MAISGVGGGFSNVSVTISAQERAQKLLKQMDADADGAVSKQEFTTFGESIKAPQGVKAPAMPSVDDRFAKVDQDSDGSLSVSDLSAMMAEHETHAAARVGGQAPGGARGASGPPPGGGGSGRPPGGAGGGAPAGGAGGAAASGGASASNNSSSASDETEPADTNKDGTVSAAEKLIYELSHPEVNESNSSSSA